MVAKLPTKAAAVKALDDRIALVRRLCFDLRQRERTAAQDAELDRLTQEAIVQIPIAAGYLVAAFFDDPLTEDDINGKSGEHAASDFFHAARAMRRFVGDAMVSPDLAKVRSGLDKVAQLANTFRRGLRDLDKRGMNDSRSLEATDFMVALCTDLYEIAHGVGWRSAGDHVVNVWMA